MPVLQRAVERLMDLYERLGAERETRLAVYREIADALGLPVPEEDR
ncbi:hypothetical protein ACFSL4_30725 [Streptomyces caeni]|uniref:Uncharacterized protein n=1 Tax=Streptomyces caeni TaxID=2307231 RepID=A0ABW4J0K6_9ACTN